MSKRPTDRYQDSPKTSAGIVESDLAWASTFTLTGAAAEVVDRINARFNPRCRQRVGYRPWQTGTSGRMEVLG